MKINELESNISRAKEKLPFMPPSDTKTELENNIKEWEEELAKLENGNRHLYTVEIPDDNGENYLHWEKPLTREQVGRITEKLKADGWNVVEGNHPTFEKNGERIVLNERAQGRDVYAELEEALGSDKAASEFLSSVGFTGISYPAEYRSGGRKDMARNFVIFNEKDAQITDHIRFFRTKNGQAYGFTVNGKIYLDPRIATAETAIHEYAHLWADMLRQMNPEAWNDIVQLMKDTSVWEEVKRLYPELKTEDEIADEVLAHYSGRRGAAKLSKEQHRIAHDQNMDLRSKATAIAALERIKQALTKFWKGVADLLHIRFTTAEEVADRVLADLLHGVNPTAYAKREDGKVRKMGTRVNRYMANIASHFNEAELTPSQQAVVDVYSGKSDNQAISVEREDGKRKVVMRQGNENHAGAKHSLYRHFSRNEGTITADDILLIPQVLEKGEMKIVKNGKGKLYSLEKDGVKYKVYTEKKDSQEIFCDFYTNKKGNNTRPYISERDAQNGNTQLSARAGRIVANDAANVAQSSDTSNSNTPESTDIDHILGNGNSKQGEKVRQHMETIAQKLGLKLNWVSSNKQSNGCLLYTSDAADEL